MSDVTGDRAPEALPWGELMNAGLGRLGLAPSVFWGMTLQELDAALTGAFGICARDTLVRDDLRTLMTRFPDGESLCCANGEINRPHPRSSS